MSELSKYIDGPVRKLVELIPTEISPADQERHRLYCLLLMAMVAHNFCARANSVDAPAGKEHGMNPLLPEDHELAKRGQFLRRDYNGHNIAAFAVDRKGRIIDFDFNHNELFNSSVEHAEARLLNRLFKLSKIHDSWAIGPQPDEFPEENRYSKALRGVTVYTSLESCAQCSGIMTLGNVKEVVYLQDDPGQYKIGNIMYHLTNSSKPGPKQGAPRPIPASLVGLAAFDQLNAAYNAYADKHRPGMTAFLCTDAAYKIFLDAERALVDFEVRYPGEPGDPCDQSAPLNNAGVKVECLSFYQYVVDKGRRGTPH